ncbi:MAG: PAS domain-containing protein [Pyrinomonadaceae bacterium]|nr:PAS domain-containing protein [Pyrinomonadaceae bacterium]
MMKHGRAIPFLRSVRAKLLLMLALLSLPLLVISLLQLNNYRRDLNEQAAAVARIESLAAAGTLTSWLEDHPAHATRGDMIAPTEALALTARLRQHAAADNETAIAVFDPQGRALKGSIAPGPLPISVNFSPTARSIKWNDGVSRMTSAQRVEPFGWAVAVGVPLAEHTNAGRSVWLLAATWAIVLLTSVLLGYWAVGRFTKPLRKLALSASVLGQGELHERASVETDDEVGALAQNFNVMATHLQAKFKEVQTQGAFIEEVLDGLPLGVLVLDAHLIVQRANQTFARFVGRDATQLAGRGLYEAAAGVAVLSDVIEDVRRTRKPFVTYGLPLNLVARNKETGETENTGFWDVTIWPMTERSAVRGDLIFVLSEVSKRVRAEKLATSAFAAERTRAAELESVINQMNEGVVIIDRQHRYKINPAAAVIIGRNPNDFRDGAEALISDIALRDAADGRALAPEETPLWRALEARETISNVQLQINHNDGEKRRVAVSATPLLGDDGRQEGAVAVFRDITEEVLQHEQLVAAYDRLREHDRLKTAFVSNMTHELRTPLNVIIGLCQLLMRDKQLPLAPLQGEAVTRMERNARSLLELVNDLLDYSRLEAGRSALQLEKVDVAALMREMVEDYEPETRGKGIELRAEVSKDLGQVLTDRHKLQQVLSNLLGNAVKFTTAGRVTIRAAPLNQDRWYLEVSDTGIGISSDAISYIFDEFRQVDDRLTRSYGGTGLGLAITRKIVELLEGEITVKSEPQEGSRFRITWPRIVRQRTGTGSLVGKSVPAPPESGELHRPRTLVNGK